MGKLKLLLSAGLVAGLVTTPAHAEPAPPAESATVTLLTGDRVTLDGTRTTISPGPGRQHVPFHRRTKGDHVQVIPDDALPLLAADKLDEQLFDITGLVQQKYDDAHTGTLPILRANRTPAKLSKEDTNWKTLQQEPGKIWLDAKVRISLDQSVPMTGAPKAWEQGVKGDGVKVAVLDTGIDPGHPEVKAVEARDFTGTGDATDRQGHGTHVASTVAGRGAKYTGVAPNAELMVGKVLDDSGWGQTSWIIAGMEWAARGGARVINMSLGGMPTDGTDPLSQAVNDLTAETGALFVVAAGNNGASYTIGSPGAADQALTVGSVEKDGKLSWFSSRGPRKGDDAVKPDITAPGGAIVAARAKGTLPNEAVDELHAKLSGTSMATPHVAGAAALLAQRNPSWKAQDLKAALMNQAEPDGSAYDHGAGRLSIDFNPIRTSTGSISFGRLAHPLGRTVSREVTYYNDGPATRLDLRTTLGKVTPATLDLPAHGSAKATVEYTSTAVGRFEGELTGGPRVVLGVSQAPEEYDLTLKTLRRDGKPASLPNMILTDGETYQWPVVGPEGTTVRVKAGTYTVYGTQPERTPEFVAESVITFALGGIDVHENRTVVVDGAQSRPVEVTLHGDPLARVLRRSEGASVPGKTGIESDGPRGMPFYGMSRDANHVRFSSLTTAARPQLLMRAADFEPVVDYAHASTHFNGDADLPVTTALADAAGKLVLLRDNGNSTEQIREAVAKGAKAVLFPKSRFGVWPDGAPVPVLEAPEPSFQRLLNAVAVNVRAFGTSPFSYHVAFTENGVPNGKEYEVRQRDLAKVDVTYRSAGVTATGVANGVPTTFPQQRTEYYTPGRWFRVTMFTDSWFATQVSPEYAFERGKSYRHTWFPAVFAPGDVELGREDDAVRVFVDVFSTNVSRDAGDVEIDRGSLTLSRDGHVFGTSRMPSFGQFENVPPGPLQLDLTATRDQPWWGLSTKIDTRWRFQEKPLVVKYGLADNTMRRGQPFDVSFTRQAKTVQVWSSTDDGRSWQEGKVRQVGSRWLVLPRNDAGPFVSLRVKATAANGDEVDQTVLRAYAQR